MILPAGAQYKPGDVAGDFSLKNVDGKIVSLSDMTDAKGFIVAFWCNTCPVVKQYETRLVNIHKEYASKGFPVIAVNSNDPGISPGDSFDEMKKVARNKNYGFHYLYDESQQVARRFGATNTPHLFLLSKRDGKLVVEYTGAIDNNAEDASLADKKYLSDAVNSLLRGSGPQVKSTRAIGCSIKWKKS
ncbi:MAG: thioredoxin family protein [Bacteroidales bacterium]|nr:thioredoxin family protein [Bacteroidales bacterium]